MNSPPVCERCRQPLGNPSATNICPDCVAQLGSASWLEEEEDGETSPSPDLMRIRYFGDYELLEEIAQGGMGVVFKARQASLNRIVAVKMIRASLLASEADIRRFRSEAEAAGSLRHPNIVAIHEVGEHQDQHYFSMDFLSGQSLAQLVREHLWSAERAAGCVKTIAEAIHFAHQSGILHLDLKPSNVVMDDAGKPHITDFGLAKRLGGATGLTITGAVLGSPSYMSPEQACGKRADVSAASDVYSLGAILYELLSGRPPFQGETTLDTVQLVVDTDAVSPRLLNPTIPRELETISLKCLEKDPKRRYRSAQDLAEDLGRFLLHEPVQARRAGNPERLWRWCQRKPAVASLGCIAVLLLVLGISGVTWQWRQALLSAEQARQILYAADMKQAQQFVKDDNLGDALKLLERHRPKETETTDPRGFEWRYLWQRCQGDSHVFLPTVTNRVMWIEYSPDGHRVAASADGGVLVFDVNSRSVIANPSQWSGPDGIPPCALFTPDGKTLIVANHGEVNFFETAHWTKQTLTLTNAAGPIAVSADGTALAALQLGPFNGWSTVRIWNLHTLEVSATLTNLAGPLVFAPDGQRLATYSPEGIKLWPLRESAGNPIHLQGSSNLFGTIIAGFATHEKTIAYSPDGRLVAAGGQQGDVPIMLWNSATGERLDEDKLTAHNSCIKSVVFSPDSQLLASCSLDNTIRIWDVAARKCRRKFLGHLSEVWSLAFAPDGKNLVSGGSSDHVRIWPMDLTPPLQEQDFKDHWKPLWISTNGAEVITLESDRLERWETTSGQVIQTVRSSDALPGVGLGCLEVSPDGRTLVCGYQDGTIRIRSLASGDVSEFRGGHSGPVTTLAVSPDGKTLVSASSDLKLCWWELASVRLPAASTLPEAIGQVAFSPDGKTLATVNDSRAQLWNVATRSRLPVSIRAWGRVAFSPHGRTLAINGAFELWDATDGKSLGRLQGNKQVVLDTAFSPDGRNVASAGADGTLRLWSVKTHQELLSWSRKGTTFDHPLFSADGRALVAGGYAPDSGGLRLWRAPSFVEIKAIEKANLHNH